MRTAAPGPALQERLVCALRRRLRGSPSTKGQVVARARHEEGQEEVMTDADTRAATQPDGPTAEQQYAALKASLELAKLTFEVEDLRRQHEREESRMVRT